MSRRRFIARSELVWHELGNGGYAGPGWLATSEEDRPGRPISFWENDALAHDLFVTQEGNEAGTSIVVVGFWDPSNDAEQSPEQIADQIESAVAEHFWPALVDGSLTVTVQVAEGRATKRTAQVEVASAAPELTHLLTTHARDEVSEGLYEPGDVVRIPVYLEVPECFAAEEKHPAFSHTAYVLVRRADPTEDSVSLGRAQYFRGTGMVIMQPDLSRLLVGAQPFHVAVLCGLAAGDSIEDERAERFLRAAERPEHDNWGLTEKVQREYARGSGAAIGRFLTAVRSAVKDVLAPVIDSPEDGPRDLAAMFKFGEPQPPDRAPRLVVDSAVVNEHGAWQIEGTVRIPVPNKRIVGRPTVVFLGETGGGSKVKWAELVGQKNCVAQGDLLIIEKSHRSARFRGTTDPDSHPVPVSSAAVSVDFRAVREGVDAQ